MSLTSFFWKYFRRHLLWVGLSLAAIVVFAATTAAMLALLHPIAEEVLQADRQELDRTGLGALTRSAGEETEAASESELTDGSLLTSAIARGRHVGERIKQRVGELYSELKRRCDVREGNLVLTPIAFAPLLFVLVFLIRSVASFISTYSFQRIGLGMTTDIRNDLYRRIIHQSASFHAQHTSGELYSRIVSDVTKLQNAVSSRLLDVFLQLASLLVYIAVLMSIHAPLTLVCLIGAPAIVYPLVRFGRGMRWTSHRSQERMADLSALLTEGIRGNRVVKAFGMEEFEGRRFDQATHRHLKVNLRAQLLSSVSSPVIESTAAIGGAGLLVWAGHMIRDGDLSFPTFFQFLTTLLMMYDPVRRLNKVNLVLQEAVAAAQRVRDLMAVPVDIVDRPRHPPITVVTKGICFESVSFAYARKDVLREFELEVSAGETIALVGPSGAGKTTVVNLLPRFFDPTAGRITIDGIDIRDLPLQNLRSLIGIVTQETTLFNDTVRNNIAYGRSDLKLERVREAAAAAYADEFIMELEQGYETTIGEEGAQLSGGQRQRLAIARALLKNAPILILDEATSHLDTGSEALVQRALGNLMQGRTALVIAHRLSTVRRSDRILVMEAGRIIEEGTHDQLIGMNGPYKRLYDLQFRS